jgi:hypothetical protein
MITILEPYQGQEEKKRNKTVIIPNVEIIQEKRIIYRRHVYENSWEILRNIII